MHVAAGRKFANKRARIFAPDGGLGAEHGDAFCHRLRASRLDCRHRANERNRKSRAQLAERKRRGGVAGDDNQIGFVFADRSTEHVDNALDQPVLIQVSIGKVGVIR